MAELLLKRIQPRASNLSLLFRTRSLWILLGLIMMGHLIAGYQTGADSVCSGCTSLSAYSESFTIRNALPQGNSDLHMVCYIWSDCGGFSTYSAVIPCKSVEVPIDQSTCSCTKTPSVEQVVCEFVWTKTNDERFVRAQVLVWSSDTAAPKKTYYVVDDTGFWFSSSPDGKLSNLGPWTGWNWLSSEDYIMGKNGKVKGFGRDHCRTRA